MAPPEEKDPFATAYRKIFAPSKALLQKEFTHAGFTYGEIFELAAGLKKSLARLPA